MISESAPNISLMLSDWLPTCIRALRSKIADHEASIVDLRAELGKLEKHAAVEGLTVDDVPPVVPAVPVNAEG